MGFKIVTKKPGPIARKCVKNPAKCPLSGRRFCLHSSMLGNMPQCFLFAGSFSTPDVSICSQLFQHVPTFLPPRSNGGVGSDSHVQAVPRCSGRDASARVHSNYLKYVTVCSMLKWTKSTIREPSKTTLCCGFKSTTS